MCRRTSLPERFLNRSDAQTEGVGVDDLWPSLLSTVFSVSLGEPYASLNRRFEIREHMFWIKRRNVNILNHLNDRRHSLAWKYMGSKQS